MRTDFLLIRHGEIHTTGTHIAGWSPAQHLNETGISQAHGLVPRLEGVRLAAIFSSPLERTRETAAPLAEARGLAVETLDDLGEIHFGSWTGRSYDELWNEREWRLYNQARGITPTPEGELALGVQARMVTALLRIRERVGEAKAAVFSHGDPIRLTLAYGLGLPVDFITRLEIAPASISVLRWEDERIRVLRVNDTGEALKACF